MNQQSSQQNYRQQQYAPQYTGQNLPQYNQQMQQYPQQNYQAAPPGSQYVTHAPSGMPLAPSQQAMMPGFGRGPDGLYRGQRRPNPCICFKWCCSGTCSLRTGCYVIGSFCAVGALGIGGSNAGTDDMIPGDKATRSYTLYSDAFFFNVLPGVLLLVGAVTLQETCCTLAAILFAGFSALLYLFSLPMFC